MKRGWMRSAFMLCLVGWLAGYQPQTTESQQPEGSPPPKAGPGTRRVIVNDDGSTQYAKFNPRAAEGLEGFLANRFRPVEGTQVDSYFWCIGDGQIPPWGPEFTPAPAIGDAEAAMVHAAHQAGIEIFASLRMNDTHDAAQPKLDYPLKVQRPDLLLGAGLEPSQRGDGDSLLRQMWSALNYAAPEVRDQKFEVIDHYCNRYDFDGLELDFFRGPYFFKFGEDEQHLGTMTEFVGRVRRRLQEIGLRRGRPYLLAARVPDTPELARRAGLDVSTWLERGYLDLLVVGGGYAQLSAPFQRFIELGHRHGVPVYPCLDSFHSPETMRATASNFWAAGADGVYLFNYSPLASGDPPHWWSSLRGSETWPMVKIEHWGHEIGSPQTLARLDKLYQVEWGHVYTQYRHASWPHQLPVPLIEWRPIQLVIGDDLEAAGRRGEIQELRLQARVSGCKPHEEVTLRINGPRIASGPGKASPEFKDDWSRTFRAGCWYDVGVDAALFRPGNNEIVVEPGQGSVGLRAAQVDMLQLWVRCVR